MNIKRYIPLLIVILFLVIITGNVFAQTAQKQKFVTVESTVKDADGTPIKNALISVREGAYEALTDADGRFSISIPADADLLVEAEGYDNLIVTIGIATGGITLTKVPFLMEEARMVSVPYGKIRRKETVGAISTLEPKKIIKYDNPVLLFNAMNNRIPGMIGNTNMRGIGDAVFIIDGIPRDPAYLMLEEIDQVTVLKDANSAVLFGSQAKNGVVLVTTRRGQASKRINSVSVEQGISDPVAYPRYLNSADYMRLYNEALTNDGLPVAYTDDLISKYESGNHYRYPSVDYYSSEFLHKIAPYTRVISEFSGGNEKTRYYTNIGWLHAGSLYKLCEKENANYNRFNIRGNVDVEITDIIKAKIDAVALFDITRNPNGNFWSLASTMHPEYFSPLLPVSRIAPDAVFTGGASLETMKRVNGDYVLGGTTAYKNNVYGNMFLSGYTQDMIRNAQFNTGLDFDLKGITEGLKFKAYLTFDVYNRYNINVTDVYAVYEPTWSTTADSITRLNKIGKDESTGVQNVPRANMGYMRRVGTYALLDYARTFNDHSLTGTLLGYYDTYRVNGVIIDEQHAHLGLRMTYDYKKKYLVDFSSALVNGYKLKPGNKGGFSPSLGLAWIISDEDFMSGNNFLNYLKLRASAGIINTEFSGSNYRLYESTFIQASNSYAWGDGSRSNLRVNLSQSENPNLTFEKMKNVNVGFEAYLLNHSLYIDANLFTTRYAGQVIRRVIYTDYTLSGIRPYENYNEDGYSGADLGINWSKSMGEFSLSVGANLLYARSKIVKRDEIWSNNYQYREGKPTDVRYGLESLGFFADPDDITNSPLQMFGEVAPGDLKYKDQNGDGIIDSNDAIEIGNSSPRVSYGLNILLKHKNLSLFAFGYGWNGYDGYLSSSYFWVQGNNKYSEEVLNRWTPETAATATYPRLSSKNSPNNFQGSTFWLQEMDFFRLDRIQLTYDLPKNLSQKLACKNISLFLRGDNLVLLSKVDATKRQLNPGGAPAYRNYGIGARIEF